MPTPACPSLTQAVVSIVRQPESIVTRAPVIPGNVDAVMNASTVVLTLTLVDICERNQRDRVTEDQKDMVKERLRDRVRGRPEGCSQGETNGQG